MPNITITLKNVPEELHRSLKDSARRNKRSLNREAIRYLEESLLASRERPSLLDAPGGKSVGKVIVTRKQLIGRDDSMMDRGV